MRPRFGNHVVCGQVSYQTERLPTALGGIELKIFPHPAGFHLAGSMETLPITLAHTHSIPAFFPSFPGPASPQIPIPTSWITRTHSLVRSTREALTATPPQTCLGHLKPLLVS